MKKILLKVVPARDPGITQAEMMAAVENAAQKFPGSPQWWAKCVQLDLEAAGVLRRDDGKPLRWRQV